MTDCKGATSPQKRGDGVLDGTLFPSTEAEDYRADWSGLIAAKARWTIGGQSVQAREWPMASIVQHCSSSAEDMPGRNCVMRRSHNTSIDQNNIQG